MLFHCERPRVDRYTKYFPVWKPGSSGTTNGEGEKLGDEIADGDGREPEKKELIETWNEDSPSKSNDPGPYCRHWHIWVIRIGYCRPDLRVRTLIVEGNNVLLVQIGVLKLSSSELLSRNHVQRLPPYCNARRLTAICSSARKKRLATTMINDVGHVPSMTFESGSPFFSMSEDS